MTAASETPPWTTSLPHNWTARRLKLVATVALSNVDKKSEPDEPPVRLCNYTDVYHHDFITAGMDFMEATASPAQIRRFQLQRDDVLITKDSEEWNDIAVPACVADDVPGVLCGYHLAILRPQSTLISGRFLFRALQASGVRDQFFVAATGITRYGLSRDGITDALLPVPPLGVQRQIASFLDRRTAAIDAVIEKKERLLVLLKEKRLAAVTQAIMKGLNPTVSLKDSGVDWLGPIPAHWTMKRLRHISPRQSVGVVVNPSSYFDENGTVPFLLGNNVSEGRIDFESARRMTTRSNKELHKSSLRAGDLVTVRVGAPGVTAVIPPEGDGCNCASLMFIRQHRSFCSEWLCFAMNSRVGRYQVELVQYGAAQKQFNIGHAVDFVFPVPPLEEQRRIAEVLEGTTNSLLKADDLVMNQIRVLREYRQALITAAVTGKLDISKEAC